MGQFKFNVGKCVVISEKGTIMHPVYFKLSNDYKAQNPEDATTVIVVSFEYHKVGEYAGIGLDAIEEECSLYFIDRASKKLILRWNLSAKPPEYYRSGQSYSGNVSNSKIEQVINRVYFRNFKKPLE